MKTYSIVQSPTTHDVGASVDFYQSLGFESVSSDEPNLFSDGKVLIGLNSERTARTTIRLFGEWSNESAELQKSQLVHENDGKLFLADPSGVFVRLEPGKSFEISGEPCSALGNFSGLSIETVDFGKTVRFWETLGFAPSRGAEEQGWMTLEREGMVGISVMKTGVCPHNFFSPGLTYFNSGKNIENIQKIRKAGVAITEEITAFNPEGIVDNVILRDPGGTGFFIFND